MELDGYKAVKDKDYLLGEQYLFYKGGKQVGWMRFDLGILRISTDVSEPFLVHEMYGEEPANKFSNSKERRKAIRRAIDSLERYYGDKKPTLRTIASIFHGVVVDQQASQLSMF